MENLYLQDQKWSEKNIEDVLTNLIWPQYLNPEQHTDRLCHKTKFPYISKRLELNYYF